MSEQNASFIANINFVLKRDKLKRSPFTQTKQTKKDFLIAGLPILAAIPEGTLCCAAGLIGDCKFLNDPYNPCKTCYAKNGIVLNRIFCVINGHWVVSPEILATAGYYY